MKANQSTLFLQTGRTYRDGRGDLVLIKGSIDETFLEFDQGSRFFGSNRRVYRDDGVCKGLIDSGLVEEVTDPAEEELALCNSEIWQHGQLTEFDALIDAPISGRRYVTFMGDVIQIYTVELEHGTVYCAVGGLVYDVNGRCSREEKLLEKKSLHDIAFIEEDYAPTTAGSASEMEDLFRQAGAVLDNAKKLGVSASITLSV